MNAILPIRPQGNSNTGGTGTSGTSGTSGTNSGLPDSQGLNNMFLQLLVAQLQNQNPLDPMDPTQFVGQLAQFSELSEVTQIEQILQQALPASSTTGGGSGGGSGANGGIQPGTGNSTTPIPAAMTSSAVAAAKATVPNFAAPATPILNQPIQGVF